MPQKSDGLMGKIKSKVLKNWARFSDDESSEIDYTKNELRADRHQNVPREEAMEKVESRGADRKFDHPVDRPDFEPPGSYPASHRKLKKEDRGPHGVGKRH